MKIRFFSQNVTHLSYLHLPTYKSCQLYVTNKKNKNLFSQIKCRFNKYLSHSSLLNYEIAININKINELLRKLFVRHRRELHQLSLTLTRGSGSLVNRPISSLVDISGYRFLMNKASSSWSCWDVKCVLCRLWRLFFFPSLSSALFTPTTPSGETTPPPAPNSCFTSVGVATSETC